MSPEPRTVQRVYLTLTLFNTLAASFIWGINTLFLLDAGLSATAAFTANALFTAGMVLFEVPTGVVADTWGRRASYLLGSVTLAVSTVLYWLAWQAEAPFWAWAVTSVLLGLGFTFFSGATEAWLVDALKFTGFKGKLESVFAKGQIVGGVAMLSGSVLGGLVAQWTNLGVPYLLRGLALVVTFVVAFLYMRDWGFVPRPGRHPVREMGQVVRGSVRYGLGNRPVRWMMLAAPFTFGVGIYAFYAMQPYLLELYGDEQAYSIAGLAAAIIAGAQIAGGMAAPQVRRLFRNRTSALLAGLLLEVGLLTLLGLATDVLGRGRAAGAVGAGRRRHPADPAGLHERPHPLGAAGDGPVVRQPARVERRGGDPAGPGQGGRRLELLHLLPGRGGVPAAGGAVHHPGRRERASSDPVEVEPAQQGA